MQRYKVSMFSKLVELAEGEAILYSSYLGMSKIIKLSKENTLTVKNWIQAKEVEYQDTILFQKLLGLGYLVETDVDEKLLRQSLINDTLYKRSLRLVVHTTEDCNFRCEYCALDFEKKPMEEDVADSIIKYIRKNIMKYDSVFISWFGGEPLLNMQVIERISKEVIKICECAKKTYRAAITTNGYLLNKKNLEILYRCKVREFVVTVDGNEKTHDKLRHLKNGNPTFEKIIGNLKEIKNEKRYHVKVLIRTNVTKEILDDLKAYYEYLNNEFGDDKRFGIMFRVASDWGGERVKKIADSLLTESIYSQIFSILQTIDNRRLSYDIHKYDFEPGGGYCQAMLRHKYTVAVDGSIHKCDTPCMKIGVLTANGDMQIDEKMNSLWSLPHELSTEVCDDCFFSCACFLGCCPKHMIINKKNNQCTAFLEGIDELIKLIAQTETMVTL